MLRIFQPTIKDLRYILIRGSSLTKTLQILARRLTLQMLVKSVKGHAYRTV